MNWIADRLRKRIDPAGERAFLAAIREWRKKVLDGFKVRMDEKQWLPGKFVHPHDACFDKDGNIYVVEWVQTGRVTQLRKLA